MGGAKERRFLLPLRKSRRGHNFALPVIKIRERGGDYDPFAAPENLYRRGGVHGGRMRSRGSRVRHQYGDTLLRHGRPQDPS